MSRPTRQAKTKALKALDNNFDSDDDKYECPPPLHQRLLEWGIASQVPKPSTVVGRGIILLRSSSTKPGSSGDNESFEPGTSSGSDVSDEEFSSDDASEYEEVVDLDDSTETSSSDDEPAIHSHETMTFRNELIV